MNIFKKMAKKINATTAKSNTPRMHYADYKEYNYEEDEKSDEFIMVTDIVLMYSALFSYQLTKDQSESIIDLTLSKDIANLTIAANMLYKLTND